MLNKTCTVCGEPLMEITDPEIIGREGQVWFVCPLILYGDTAREHTSVYEEILNDNKNVLPDLQKISRCKGNSCEV